ncbi:MAG TPA: hypothetical protein VI248_18430 [Kineosporiaceae bacterium]
MTDVHPRPDPVRSRPAAPWADPAPLVHAGRDELACERCGARVLVSKNSLRQTCVQWSRQAEARCVEFTTAAAVGRPAALVDGCRSLRDSIEDAVRTGRLAVQDRS